MDKVYHEPLEIQIFYSTKLYTKSRHRKKLKILLPNSARDFALPNFFSSTIPFFKRCKIELKSPINNDDFLALNLKIQQKAKAGDHISLGQ